MTLLDARFKYEGFVDGEENPLVHKKCQNREADMAKLNEVEGEWE